METMIVTPNELLNLLDAGQKRGFIAGVIVSAAVVVTVKHAKKYYELKKEAARIPHGSTQP